MVNKKLLRSFFSFSYGGWISLIIGLGSSIITTRILSPDIFGKTSMYTLAINVSMVLIVLGTDQAFVRFFYEEEENNRSRLLYYCIKIPLALFGILSVIILLNSEFISTYLFGESRSIYSLLLITGLLLNLLNRYSILVVRMQQKGALYSNLHILNKVLNTISIIVIYFLIGEKVEVIILSTIFTLLVVSFIAIIKERGFWFKRNNGNLKLKNTTKEIVKFGYPMMFTTLVFWLFQSFDKIALREWSTFYELGLYSASFRIISIINIVQTTFTAFWSPICYEHYQKNPGDTRFYERMYNMISFVMLAIGILTITGKDIIVLLLGPEYRATAHIMPFLVFIPIMYTISETTVVGINFMKKTHWHVIIAIVACTVNIVGNWILVPTYGAIGASFSTAVSYIVFFTARTIVSTRLFNLQYNLKRLYFFIFSICIYAFFTIFNNSLLLNGIVGLMLFFILVFSYKEQVEYGISIFANTSKKGLLKSRR